MDYNRYRLTGLYFLGQLDAISVTKIIDIVDQRGQARQGKARFFNCLTWFLRSHVTDVSTCQSACRHSSAVIVAVVVLADQALRHVTFTVHLIDGGGTALTTTAGMTTFHPSVVGVTMVETTSLTAQDARLLIAFATMS